MTFFSLNVALIRHRKTLICKIKILETTDVFFAQLQPVLSRVNVPSLGAWRVSVVVPFVPCRRKKILKKQVFAVNRGSTEQDFLRKRLVLFWRFDSKNIWYFTSSCQSSILVHLKHSTT